MSHVVVESPLKKNTVYMNKPKSKMPINMSMSTSNLKEEDDFFLLTREMKMDEQTKMSTHYPASNM